MKAYKIWVGVALINYWTLIFSSELRFSSSCHLCLNNLSRNHDGPHNWMIFQHSCISYFGRNHNFTIMLIIPVKICCLWLYDFWWNHDFGKLAVSCHKIFCYMISDKIISLVPFCIPSLDLWLHDFWSNHNFGRAYLLSCNEVCGFIVSDKCHDFCSA